jgi:hypothetical protein
MKTFLKERLISPILSGKVDRLIATIEANNIPALMAIRVVVLEAIGARSSFGGRAA